MAKNSMDIEQMLDSLGLGEMSMRLDALVRSPEGMDLSPLQLLREIVTAQYTLHRNEQFRVFRQEFLYIIIVTFPHFYRALEKEHKASPLTVQAGRPA